MKLHQLGTIPLETRDEGQSFMMDEFYWSLTAVVENNEELEKLSGFELVALADVIRLQTGYVMSDFLVVSKETELMKSG